MAGILRSEGMILEFDAPTRSRSRLIDLRSHHLLRGNDPGLGNEPRDCLVCRGHSLIPS